MQGRLHIYIYIYIYSLPVLGLCCFGLYRGLFSAVKQNHGSLRKHPQARILALMCLCMWQSTSRLGHPPAVGHLPWPVMFALSAVAVAICPGRGRSGSGRSVAPGAALFNLGV